MTLEIQKLRLVTLLNYYCKCIITFPKPRFTIVPYFLVCILIINLSLLGAPVSFIVAINRMCKISIKWNRLICIKWRSSSNPFNPLRRFCIVFRTSPCLCICFSQFVLFFSLLSFIRHQSIKQLVVHRYKGTPLKNCNYKEHYHFVVNVQNLTSPLKFFGHIFRSLLRHLCISIITLHFFLQTMLVVLPHFSYMPHHLSLHPYVLSFNYGKAFLQLISNGLTSKIAIHITYI